MHWSLELLSLLVIGGIAGFINTNAGGGSLLTLPMLMFFGLPEPVANATNRVAIVFQNIFSVKAYQSKGVFVYPYVIYLTLSSLLGALVGIFMAIHISPDAFRKTLVGIMLVVAAWILVKPYVLKKVQHEDLSRKKIIWGVLSFFFIGIYGGFIQAGVGFIMIALLTLVNQLNLVKTNSIKVFVALSYNVLAIIIFAWNDLIEWQSGLSLAAGTSIGGYLGSLWGIKKGDAYIKWVLIAAMIAMAIKLIVSY